MRNVISNNPFLKENSIDSSKLHVTFLSEIVQKTSLEKLAELSTSPDRFYSAPHEIYIYCPVESALGNGYYSKLEDDQ